MNLIEIAPENLKILPFSLWHIKCLLLTSGDFQKDHFNSMTVGWGSIGSMWSKPFAQVVVRPTRYTFEFMNRYDSFTLCAFPKQYRKALNFLGSRSGRDSDKIKESGLTPCPSQIITAPAYDEAELILECKKVYWQDIDPSHFLDPATDSLYPQKDYHRIYFGEIVAARGIADYRH